MSAPYPEAPFFQSLAQGDPNVQAHWLTTEDGVRLRAAIWPLAGAQGTVLLFPGRTEYVEKYGEAARDLALRGFATLAIDWRGQGLADRPLADRMIGHVCDFHDYQADVRALVTMAKDLNLPQPFYMLAHSMGGCIGLRSLINGLPVAAAAFSAPMWGIAIQPVLRPIARPLAAMLKVMGLGTRPAPGTSRNTYVAISPFENNVLTKDAEMWRYMQRQVQERPELALGAPSIGWVSAALAECRSLALTPSPTVPVLTGLGSDERVVEKHPISERMKRWRNAGFREYPNAEHELMMEQPALRTQFFDDVAQLFAAHR